MELAQQMIDLNDYPELGRVAQTVSNTLSLMIEAHGIRADVVISVAAAVIADYARANGKDYLLAVTKLMVERGEMELPPNKKQAEAMAEREGEQVH